MPNDNQYCLVINKKNVLHFFFSVTEIRVKGPVGNKQHFNILIQSITIDV